VTEPRASSSRSEDGPTHQVVVLAVLARIGGADRFMDIEELTLAAFEVAPSRFSWRTRPDLPSPENVRWALSHAKQRDLVAQSMDGQSWKLTAQGVAYVRKHSGDLARANVAPPTAGKDSGRASERVAQLRRHAVYSAYAAGTPVADRERHELADLLVTPPDAPKALVLRKLDSARAAAEVVGDGDVLAFLDYVAKEVVRKWS
jgi:hypothetical protein